MKTVWAARHCVLTAALATIVGVITCRDAHAQAVPVPAPARGQDPSSIEYLFNQTCAACHGAGGTGGDRAPPLVNSPHLRSLPDERIKTIIHEGTAGGMPPFSGLPETELARLVAFIRSNNVSAARSAPAQNIAAGERIFFGSSACSQCHMVGGRGGVNGPDLTSIALRSSEPEIERMLDDPTSQIGIKTTSWCPGWAFCPDTQWAVVDVKLRDGTSLRGFARNRGEHDLQLQTLDGKIRLLTENDYVSIASEAQSYMPPFHGTADEKRDLLDYLGSLSGVPLGPIARILLRAIGLHMIGDLPATATAPLHKSRPRMPHHCRRNGYLHRAEWVCRTPRSCSTGSCMSRARPRCVPWTHAPAAASGAPRECRDSPNLREAPIPSLRFVLRDP
jgi:mono/diheme cytochrome c family protein